MKLQLKNKNTYFLKPDPQMAGLLLYGVNPARIQKKKNEFINALLGLNANEEMRLTIISTTDLRKEPNLLIDAMKAQGFFPGRRCILVENASDRFTTLIQSVLMEWKHGDAHILLTANLLSPRSSLRKLFEDANNVYIAPIFDDPPSQGEVIAEIKRYNLPDIEKDALEQLLYLGQSLSPDEFSQTLEKISLYKLSNSSPLTYNDIKELAPYVIEAGIEEATNIVAEGRTSEVGPLLRKLESQGIHLVHICVSTTAHFKKLYRASNDSNGPEIGIRNLKPPVPFNKSARLVRQVKSWNATKLSHAISLLSNLDIELRSNSNAPNNARIERAMIRLSLMNRIKN